MRALVLSLALLVVLAPVAAAVETTLEPPASDGALKCTGLPCDLFCALWDRFVSPTCPIA